MKRLAFLSGTAFVLFALYAGGPVVRAHDFFDEETYGLRLDDDDTVIDCDGQHQFQDSEIYAPCDLPPEDGVSEA